MAPKTIKEAITETLEDLTEENLQRFCDRVLDRRAEPRVRRCRVEGKRPWEVADVLVSTFTEARAVAVAQEILRLIGCGNEAEKLDSQTKHFWDKGDPSFRRTSDGRLDLNPSQEALTYSGAPTASHAGVKKPGEVATEARNRVLSEGGDPDNDRLVLSRYIIQFGKYKGQSFKWLLENHVQYAAWLVGSHQSQGGSSAPGPLTSNKDYLTQYATAYPEFLKQVKAQARAASQRVQSTRGRSTRSQSTRGQSTRSQSTRGQSTRSQSTRGQSTRSQSTRVRVRSTRGWSFGGRSIGGRPI